MADSNDGRSPGKQLTYPRHQRGFVSPEIKELLVPPLKVGTWTGVAGALAGVGGAIARETSPFASGVISGVQWFTLGSSYWFARIATMKAYGGEHGMRPEQKTIASAIAGSAAGAVSGLTRGPSKIFSAMAIWGVIGAGGQMIANRRSELPDEPQLRDQSEGWLSKLTPLKKLSDKEYTHMMEEKILKVEADMALIDDRIAELRAAERRVEDTREQKTR